LGIAARNGLLMPSQATVAVRFDCPELPTFPNEAWTAQFRELRNELSPSKLYLYIAPALPLAGLCLAGFCLIFPFHYR
jgi:hypothetical protein